jgi:hypothetical protein
MGSDVARNDGPTTSGVFADREGKMSDEDLRNQPLVYTFQGNSPADELLEIARMHHQEARHLLDHAHDAEAEDRTSEARLLSDLAIARMERAEEFERAARGETGDPIVAEILDVQQELSQNYSPQYTPLFLSKEDQFRMELPKHMQPLPPGRFARAVAWISRWLQ